MTLIRKLVLVLCLGLLFTRYSNAQNYDTTSGIPLTTNTPTTTDLTTGNLISMGSWTGVRYTDSVGVGFCCSGGPNPALNQDTNTLRFSYGYMAAAQSIALSRVFEGIGTGIKVTGYNYSWQINNEGYTSGLLSAKVNLVGSNGNLLESYNYDYSRYIPGFETFSGTQKFSVDYGVPSLQSLDVTFTGKDNRFWAGYYGPRVRDVNVSLNYAYDTSKPTAPTTLPTVITNVDTVATSTASSGLLSSTEGLPEVVQQASSTGSVVNFDGTISTTSSQPVQQPQPQQQAQQQTAQPVQQLQQSVQPAVRVAAEPQKETTTKSSGPSALAMSVVSKVQEAVKAVEKEAVAAAAQQAANDVKNAEQQTQNAIAMISAQTNQTPQQQQSQNSVGLQLPQQQQQQSSIIAVQVRSNEPQVLQTPQTQQQFSNDVSLYSLAPIVTSRPGTGINATVQTLQQQDIPVYVPLTPASLTQSENTQQTFRLQETTTIAVVNQVRGNPLNDLLEGRTRLEEMVQEQKTEELKRTITNNDLETGVTLTTMAVVPQGYALYGISLADAKFYEAKPIYQNQRIVDNVRLLRGLGSDQKHQQMVQDQYR